MRSITPAVAVLLLAASPALAQPYKIDKIEINGLHSVSDAQVRPALQEHPGDTVTVDEIKADQDRLVAALEKVNVTGGVKTSMRSKPGNHIDIIYDVADAGIQKPEVKTTYRYVNGKLATLSVTGNRIVSSEKLIEAAGLNPGDEVTEDTLKAALNRMSDEYKKVLTRKHLKADFNFGTQATPAGGDKENITITVTEKNVQRVENTDEP